MLLQLTIIQVTVINNNITNNTRKQKFHVFKTIYKTFHLYAIKRDLQKTHTCKNSNNLQYKQ